METKNDEVKTRTPIDADKEKFSDEMLKGITSLLKSFVNCFISIITANHRTI